jgi:hypothetical protein
MAHNTNQDTKVAPEPTQAMPAVNSDQPEELPQPSAQDQVVPADQGSGVKLPSVEDLVKQVESGEMPPMASTVPQFVPGHVNIPAFLRAQHQFIEVQTWFFGTSHNGHYEAALLTYSKAQAAYISALSEVLKSLGVV